MVCAGLGGFMDTLVSFFARNGLLPHAVCLTGSAGLL